MSNGGMVATKKQVQQAGPTQQEQFDQQLIKALGHPLRTQALSILNERTASPSELALEMGVSLSDVAYHVRVLKDCGCVELVSTRQVRGTVQHFYRATKRALLPDSLVRSLPTSVQNDITTKILTEILEDAGSSIESGTFSARDERHLSWTPLVLDQTAWEGLAALLAETLDRAFTLQAEASERLAAQPDAPSIQTTIALMGFESSRGKESPTEG